MAENNYSKREIDALIQKVATKIDDYAATDQLAHKSTSDALGRIEAQTNKTNGRTSRLERWQSYVIGFCACVTILLLPVLLLVTQILLKTHV